MREINFLPWREEQREREKKIFISGLAVLIMLAMLPLLLTHYYSKNLIDSLMTDNQKLQTEISFLEKQLDKIRQLKKVKNTLIARMILWQNLQEARGLSLHLLNTLTSVLPHEIYLKQLQRAGNKISMIGITQSNTAISLLMRNIGQNQWIKNPVLTEIRTIKDSSGMGHIEFILHCRLRIMTGTSYEAF